MLKLSLEDKIRFFVRYKSEGWSNEVAARKAGIKPVDLYDILQKDHELKAYCISLMDKSTRDKYLMREKKRRRNEI
jgi:hypothetical protein